MPTRRTHPAVRAVATVTTASTLALALAAPGLARPADPAPAERPAVHATIGTADRPSEPRAQAPTGSLAGTTDRTPVNAPGTDVAAPDQQASTGAPDAVSAPEPAGGEFDWTDAGIGAAGAASLLAISLAGGIALRRRQQRDPSAIAG